MSTEQETYRTKPEEDIRFAALEAAATECERMIMYPGGRQESAAHSNVWDAAKAIRSLVATPPAKVQGAATDSIQMSRATLEMIYEAMNHLGDTLNGMDAVEDGDEEKTLPAFEAVRALLDGSSVAAPVAPAEQPHGYTLMRNEDLQALYIRLSGKRQHASDCATSDAPAETPSECDCDFTAPIPDPIEAIDRDIQPIRIRKVITALIDAASYHYEAGEKSALATALEDADNLAAELVWGYVAPTDEIPACDAAVIAKQVTSWRKEVSRLNDLIETAAPAAQPKELEAQQPAREKPSLIPKQVSEIERAADIAAITGKSGSAA